MRLERPLTPRDRLVLAADARLTSLDYTNDTIWALSLAKDPATVVLETTYGLRARWMRLYPVFFADPERRVVRGISKEGTVPHLVELVPNFAALRFTPHPGVQGQLAWYIADSRTALARLSLHNATDQPVALMLGWVADLAPVEGQPLEPKAHHAVNVLTGQTGNLHVLIFLTGGPEGTYSPHPALYLDLDLKPQQTRRLTLVHLTSTDEASALEEARRRAAQPWEAHVARLRLVDQGTPALQPADPIAAWGIAFARQTAWRLLHGPWGDPPRRFLVRAREPDHGYSPNGHGSDHPPAWSGITVPELWYLSTAYLLPQAADLAADLLRGFLAAQREDGWIDAAPGPAGQQAHVLASPLLVDLAARIYAARPDPTFAEEVFDPLWRFLQVWFAPEQDTDGDGLPEWHHPAQIGLEALPEFSPWHRGSLGADLSTVEDPALWALLYRACGVLEHLAREAGRTQALAPLRVWADHLRQAVQRAWDTRRAHPLRWDRDTHLSLKGRRWARRRGPGDLALPPCSAQTQPWRPVIVLHTDAPLRPRLTLRGRLPNGQTVDETLAVNAPWYDGRLVVTAPQAYACVQTLTVAEIPPQVRVEVRSADLTRTDLTLLLPFWAGMLTPRQEAQVIQRLQSPRGYARPYGLPLVPTQRPKEATWEAVHPLWNLFLSEGLARRGERALAADLLFRLWRAAGQTLAREGYLREAYHARTGEGMGQRNVILGLPPLNPALRLAGLGRLTPQAVEVTAANAFAHPLTLHWRGVRITLGPEGGEVRLADGSVAPLPSPPARLMLQSGHRP